jgi:hypothetical protein
LTPTAAASTLGFMGESVELAKLKHRGNFAAIQQAWLRMLAAPILAALLAPLPEAAGSPTAAALGIIRCVR